MTIELAPSRARGPVEQRDFTDRDGAKELKERIEAYWRSRGYDIQVNLVEAPFHAAIRAARIDVRSELVNGLPRRRAA